MIAYIDVDIHRSTYDLFKQGDKDIEYMVNDSWTRGINELCDEKFPEGRKIIPHAGWICYEPDETEVGDIYRLRKVYTLEPLDNESIIDKSI